MGTGHGKDLPMYISNSVYVRYPAMVVVHGNVCLGQSPLPTTAMSATCQSHAALKLLLQQLAMQLTPCPIELKMDK